MFQLGLVFNQSPAEGWIRLVSGWVYHLAGLACSDCGFYVYTTGINSNRMPSTQNTSDSSTAAADVAFLRAPSNLLPIIVKIMF